MKRIALTLSVILFAFATACSGESNGILEPPAPTKATLKLTNNANVNIVEVNFALCSNPAWGGNKLGTGEVIAPGASRTWQVDPGCYDFRAHTASKVGSWYDRYADAGETLNLALSSAANELLSIGEASPTKVR